MKRVTRSLLLAIALLIATTLSALAGGWAVITLDDVPQQIVAGQAFAIGFTVRQHGRTLRDDLAPLVRFDRSDAQDSLVATAQRTGFPGLLQKNEKNTRENMPSLRAQCSVVVRLALSR